MRWRATEVAAILAAALSHGLCNPSLAVAEADRTIVFSPDRPERCDYFFVTEFNASANGVTSNDVSDGFLFTDALGLMRNIDRSRAVGASLDAHLTGGAIRLAPTIRFKQWLSGRQSLDLAIGYAPASIEQEGVIGWIGEVRYSPAAWLHAQVGACRIRNVTSIMYLPDYHVSGSTQTRLYAGVGLGGVPGVVSWGAQAIGFLGLVALFSGMS